MRSFTERTLEKEREEGERGEGDKKDLSTVERKGPEQG